MNCRFRFSLVAAGMMLAATAQALEAKYTVEDIPALQAEKQHSTASKRVTSRFTRSHYKQFTLDDDFSEGIFNRYLEMLDYNKNFLTQSDINEFDKWASEFDDQLKSGKSEAAYEIFNRVLLRRFERYQYALTVLDEPMKFDNDEEFIIDRSELPWPKDNKELDALWYSRVKYDALNLKLAGKEWEEIQETLSKRYNNAIKRLVQTKNEDVFQIYMNAFAREVDPHTSYLSPRNAEQFQSEMNLSLEGIGAVLQTEDDYTVIRSLVAGGPASNSKQLAPGDRIIGVGQEKGDVVDVIGWRLDDVVQLIKGPKGTKVRLEILPEGPNAKSYSVTIVRDKIRLEDRAVKSEVLEFGDLSVGVIEIPSFYVGLSEDTKVQLAKLNEQNVDGIVIDLRDNGGGALSEATALTGLFIKGGPVVQVRDSYGRVKVNGDSDQHIYYDGPMTILINRYSASASEIFAAALQDYGRAVVVGEQSFGKGTVQQHRSLNHIYDLFDNALGHVQYTIQKFYRINGGSTQHLGVVPDIAFPSAVDPSETGESVEDNALPWDSIKPAQFKQVKDKTKQVASLTKQHESRVKGDMEFGFILDDIARYQAEKDRNSISLNYQTRRDEEASEDKARLERLNIRQKSLGEAPFESLEDVPKDYEAPDVYLNEAAKITLDMLNIS
ncbi:carboxy terminal-processing peptidase [Thaumasiovibrio subtropicus]|uniref:carboxy terminal-processing peptidase n=1 Tax=Thaumasiovibrio subtropicus TaxID=1891207 RepID=UPI000B356364|nr:carboxy terminal-processing peptidase [Thaumasiovibrio subtropicus]